MEMSRRRQDRQRYHRAMRQRANVLAHLRLLAVRSGQIRRPWKPVLVNQRRKRITESDTGVFLRALAGLRIRVDLEPEEAVVLRLARSHRLSVYDASYLELALREA